MTRDAFEGPGRLTGTLSLEDIRRLEREGRVFYFSSEPGRRSRLHDVIHPFAARAMSPESYVVMVQVWGRRLPSDKFPSLEALESSEWKDAFEKIEFGRKGVVALIAEARGEELAARRKGWLHLKLEGYAYAMDDRGDVVHVFQNAEELAKAKL